MTVDEMARIWYDKFDQIPKRKISLVDRENLEKIDLTEAQFRYLLEEYSANAPYAHFGSFIGDIMEDLRDDGVPEDLCCTAYLSGDKTFIQAALDIESLQGAWYPGEETDRKIEALRTQLREAFT